MPVQPVANLLQDAGLLPGDRVAVYLPRCTLTAVAVYGIFKCGGVLVPVDPSFSASTAHNIISNCSARFLITQASKSRTVKQLLQQEHSIELVFGINEASLEQESTTRTLPWTILPQCPETSPALASPISPEAPAYIMYSSGSTGAPKGITHSHRSGLAYAKYSVEAYSVNSNDVIANHSPLNFDMSTFGYFSSCFAGASTLIISAAHAKMPTSLAESCSQHGVTIWYSVPLALQQMLRSGVLANIDLSSLRWVLYGGEPFPVKDLRELMRCLPQTQFSNVYGPAEVNQCTIYNVPSGFIESEAAGVPIGRVWKGAEGLILSEGDETIEDDRPGELAIHSETTMLGYWNRPDLDAQAYFRNEQNGALYYRTGDWVRRDSQGNLLFLGRKDRQIKLRGYRIELDAIEREIDQHPGVQESCVFSITRNDVKEIYCTIVPKQAGELCTSEVVEFLTGRISAYAIPTRIEICDQLPRNANGKVDRLGLQRVKGEQTVFAPQGGVPCN